MPDAERTYTIIAGGQAIQCLICNHISHHPDDVAQRYCGHCHRFHVSEAQFQQGANS